ncbi:hypothetical protein GCM10007063_24140 [Lentibacillus kapialis]|uniref:DUF1877 family protein n=1 Tax=Lentibacillus kapialis TaxID=340214 RepID=A0A917UZH6_9BACI|nr:hypothetical protein [Lentibacillus kapialis]GGK01046.1 hypothetical protein GCM10007063_24140 [Lentibacillus kapialis]
MGHDISSYNEMGQEIGYIRFTKGDMLAPLFYDLFDANEYYAGVSGTGEVATLPLIQIKKALAAYSKLQAKDFGNKGNQEFLLWQREEMAKFINSCLQTARKEGAVNVFFG